MDDHDPQAPGDRPRVTITPDAVLVRSGRSPDAPHAVLTHQEWKDLVAAVKQGEFTV
ncbi:MULTISPECIES: DUF397 domain-containing protein [unclassified Streptomyces]|uniref:DUF397 domain-containing protein n=1 Tax=Streptomycetaceae TaxID=2062 RepID=UPI002E78B7C6|nr:MULTISPECIES: DUF397 domain-containing protein [unclassified Streptomyces]MED7949815.1 DUF397 domain-containing protein [Streptomyces sp. BE303]MEE1828122.1 DUF397 domain-containing protein [Streptomyces sp. BE20]